MRHALVTGGAGFIGSHLVDRLLADGWRVSVVDDLRNGSPDPQPREGLTWYDEADSDGRRFDDLDAIFHLASPVGPLGVLNRPHRIVSDIIAGAETVAEMAAEAGVPLVFIGTSESYGTQPGPAAETAACVFGPENTARSAYAIGKRAAETMLTLWPGLDVRIVRPFNVAGPRQRAWGGFVIPRWIEQASAGQPITVYAPGTQRRAFCHVADFVDGLMRVLTYGRSGRVYNLSNPDNAGRIRDLAAAFVVAWGDLRGERACLVTVDPRTLHGDAFREAPDKLPNIGRAVQELGWVPRLSTDRILRDAIEAAA